MNLSYTRSGGGPALIFTEPALATMSRFQQQQERDKEAGGQLFAVFEGVDTLIVEATPPTLLDRRTRNGFRPNRGLQQQEIREKYNQGLHFVGDWHTHPESIPHPSEEDLRNMQECFARSAHDLRAFVLITIGTKPLPAGLHVVLVEANGVEVLLH